eukprot:CAMPEP_0197035322 /NCGR_PEP_ID=MMETSP1384-20130603/13162_1 /TAXON_ID=29189 /ORGANISM="Ammonia sp." /LENGTH=536 /DNA_ID=CAMNT_0042465371 /DNA_START=68 /DNA_END=1675 /DNA_ORIENTATION=+
MLSKLSHFTKSRLSAYLAPSTSFASHHCSAATTSDNVTFPRKGLSDLKYGSMKNLHHFPENSKILILGYGSIGEGVLPLVLRHFNIAMENITVSTAADRGKEAQAASAKYGVNCEIVQVTKDNYEQYLGSKLNKGDLLINASVDVSSVDTMEYCMQNNIVYIDTVVEPWKGGYSDHSKPISQRSNYALRESVLELKRKYANHPTANTTAISCHGANPGMVSHFVKQALVDIAIDTGYASKHHIDKAEMATYSRAQWAALAHALGVKVMHIAERDTQRSATIRKGKHEFVNTWSIDGFISEGCHQPAELGWGSHEKVLPYDGEQHSFGNGSAIYLKQPGALTQVRSWTPMEGAYVGWLVTHNESITLSDYFTVKQQDEVVYRPTVHYAYHPCDDAVLSLHEFIAKRFDESELKKTLLLYEDMECGVDELGVLLCGHERNAYWYGSQLDVKDVGDRIEDNQATSLQVTATLLAGAAYAMKHPNLGVLECEELDYKFILDVIEPYVAPLVGQYSDWNPLQKRNLFGFSENANLDQQDPW